MRAQLVVVVGGATGVTEWQGPQQGSVALRTCIRIHAAPMRASSSMHAQPTAFPAAWCGRLLVMTRSHPTCMPTAAVPPPSYIGMWHVGMST